MSFTPDIDSVLKAMSRKGYRIFSAPDKPFDLNIVGIRSSSLIPDSFDDWITLFYWMNNRWIFNAFPATTDPGLYWLGSPMNDLGTAILKEGQWRGMLELGTHKGYRALVQKAPVTVVRDFDRDNRLDLSSGREETGVFGINLHRASAFKKSIKVDKWSAGCQVVADPLQFNLLIDVCEKAKGIFGNSFTYTLLREPDLVQ